MSGGLGIAFQLPEALDWSMADCCGVAQSGLACTFEGAAQSSPGDAQSDLGALSDNQLPAPDSPATLPALPESALPLVGAAQSLPRSLSGLLLGAMGAAQSSLLGVAGAAQSSLLGVLGAAQSSLLGVLGAAQSLPRSLNGLGAAADGVSVDTGAGGIADEDQSPAAGFVAHSLAPSDLFWSSQLDCSSSPQPPCGAQLASSREESP